MDGKSQYELKPRHFRFRCAAPCLVFLHFPTNIPVRCTFFYCI